MLPGGAFVKRGYQRPAERPGRMVSSHLPNEAGVFAELMFTIAMRDYFPMESAFAAICFALRITERFAS